MHAQPSPAVSLPTTLAPRLGLILRNLAALIAHRFLHDPLRAALVIPLWQHLARATLRLERLLVRLAAGPIPPQEPRAHAPRAHAHNGLRRKSPFPTQHAWLIRALGSEAAACAAQLEALLADPAAADLLASPAARRALAPIRRMLGLPPAPPRRPAPAPAFAAKPPRRRPIPHHPSTDPIPKGRIRPWWLPPSHLSSA